MTELGKRTWPEAGELLGPETVAILPIGATEPHGPHLPLDTDVTIAQAQSRRAAERLHLRLRRDRINPTGSRNSEIGLCRSGNASLYRTFPSAVIQGYQQ